jgi:hypothetical protein
MKIVLTLLLLAVPAFAADSNAKLEKEVSASMDAWKQAMLKGDAAVLEKLYSSDLTYEHSSAKLETKAEAIASATKPGEIAKAIDIRNSATRLYGNTAVVRLEGNFTSYNGTVNNLDMIMVWIKGASGWQLVARQATKRP